MQSNYCKLHCNAERDVGGYRAGISSGTLQLCYDEAEYKVNFS